MNQKLMFFILIATLMLARVPFALCMTPAPIIYVAGDGSGDFNCDGADDQIEINQALQYVMDNPEYTTVHFKGPFTYTINDTILISNCTTLEGDSSATIKLVSNAGWPVGKPLIKERDSYDHDITIKGFTIDGNREGNTNVNSGTGYYNLIHLSNCQNIDIHDMYLTNNHGDGLKTSNCSNIKFYDNKIYLLGHDGLYAYLSSGVEAYNNNITCRTNSGLRLYNTNSASLHDNVITSEGSGGAGIEIQKEGTSLMDDIEVYNNVIYETALAGIWMFGSGTYSTSSANVHIHHNQIFDTGTSSNTKIIGGILSNGFNALIENNVIDGAYGASIVQNNVYSPAPTASGYVITVRNNIITNTRESAAGGDGCGIYNLLTETNSFVLQNNCLYNNSGGDYIGAQASPQDISLDPQYADRDKHDYHLKSRAGRWNGIDWVNDSINSPCIDTGFTLSDYSNEPEPNGNRINMGSDGNTRYASKSDSYVPTPIFPTADFSTNITGGYTPLSVQFTDISQNAMAWNWDFGDDSYSTQQNPVHTYFTAGSYTVNLTVTNGNGTNSKLTTIAALAQPVLPAADFTSNMTNGNAPLFVQFTDLSKNAASRNWSFGDGATSTEQNPMHLYSAAGIYTVMLTATNAAGSNTITKPNYIAVAAVPQKPVASFISNAISGYAPFTVAFTDTSTGAPSVWNWNFGDKQTSKIASPTHTYTKAGTYTVSLTVQNAVGNNTTVRSGYIRVIVPPKPIAAFSGSPISGTMPLTVQFTDSSTGFPASWRWTFGDGQTSTQQNPTHTYNKVGKYTVSLTATNTAGSNQVTKSSYINVIALPKPPVAAFSASTTSGRAPLKVTFTDKSTNTPTAWAWSFGDGATSTVKNPVYTYRKAGSYTVTLTATNSAGNNTVRRTNYIKVR